MVSGKGKWRDWLMMGGAVGGYGELCVVLHNSKLEGRGVGELQLD